MTLLIKSDEFFTSSQDWCKKPEKKRENSRQMAATCEENIILASFVNKVFISSVFAQQSYILVKSF